MNDQPTTTVDSPMATRAATTDAPTDTPTGEPARVLGNGGNGHPTQILIGSPTANAAVVGANAGVPVEVSGSIDGDFLSGRYYVDVSLGGDYSKRFAVDADDGHDYLWSYRGLTDKGGEITIGALLYRSPTPTPPEKSISSASVRVKVNDNPALSAAIVSPADGANIQTWTGPTIASGTATFDATLDSRQVAVKLGSQQGLVTLDGGSASGSQVNYNWTYSIFFTESGSTTITAEAVGTFTDSQGIVTTHRSQTPSTRTVKVDIDRTSPDLNITSPPPGFQLPDDPNGVKITVTGTATDSQSGVSRLVISGDVVSTVPLTPPTSAANAWDWSATITVPHILGPSDNGQRNIVFQCWDKANNPPTVRNLTLYLEAPFQTPLDPNDSLSILAYLRDLTGFSTGANGRIQTSAAVNAAKVQAQELERYFCQPFTLLTADEQVHQVRLCIEVLRKYIEGPLDPVGYWQFDEGSGTTVTDSSGNGLRGTLNNTTWTPGRLGAALQFNGSSAYVQIGDLPQLKMTAAVTMAAWIYPTGPGSGGSFGGTILCKEAEYEMARYADGSIQCAFANTTPGWNWINTGYNAPLNQWTHIAVIYDGASVSTYANGRQVNRTPASGPIGSANPTYHDFRIGGRQWISQYFQGSIDEAKVFNRALNADEVAFLAIQGMPSAQLMAAEASYRQLTYRSLLLNLGTSYDELRLARAGDNSTRSALAARLGIELQPSRPDRLDALVLQQNEMSEAKLEQLFGLKDTTRNPLSAQPQDADLLTWQKDHLRTLWTQEDHPTDADPHFPLPLIDPDVLVEDDFAPPAAGSTTNVAHDIWSNRRNWVDSQLQALANDRRPGETDQARLVRLIEAQLKSVKIADLLGFNTLYNQGTSIDAKLSPIPLSFAAFSYLLRLYNLAAGQKLLDDEWAAAYSILVQAQKAQQYTSWVAQEQNPGAGFGQIIVSPTYFRLNPHSATLPGWRATEQARQSFQDKLSSRIGLLDALEQALRTAAGVTEEACLPSLRDALVAAVSGIAVPSAGVTNLSPNDWLTERLLIDVESSGAIQTSRVSQAIETIQSLLFSVRTRRFGILGNLGAVADWQITIPDTDFDQDWAWMGTYQTWRAGMEVFLYPENVLSPNLWGGGEVPRRLSTKHFSSEDRNKDGSLQFLQTVRNHMPLTREQARTDARAYLSSLQNDPEVPLPVQLKDPNFAITDDVDSVTFTLAPGNTVKGLAGWRAVQSDPQNGVFKNYVDLTPAPPHLKTGFSLATLPGYLPEIFCFVPLHLALQLHQSGDYEAALDWFRLVYAYDSPDDKRRVYYGLVLEQAIQTKYERSFIWMRDLDPHEAIAPTRANAYTRFTLLSLVRCFLDFADGEFTRDTEENRSLARDLYLNALELLSDPALVWQTKDFQQNPIPGALADRANNNLRKLRSNLSISGLRRQGNGAIGSGTGLSVFPGGRLASLGSSGQQPTPYRYSTLIDRAKQLAQLAQQVEASYLAALQQEDAESYNLLKANQDLELANANLDLQALKVNDANDAVTLATDQKARAQTQFDTYNSWINAGPLDAENDMIQQYRAANAAKNWIAGVSAAITAANAITTAASGGFLGTGLGAGDVAAAAVTGLTISQDVATVAANNAEASAQIDSASASFERRSQEWQLQKSLAQNDLTIGDDQIKMANDQKAIATKEQDIANTQSAHDQAIVSFLNTKFTNVELYEWMSGVLGGVYRYFLQQATATAQLAENQLSFERQQPDLGVIKADYWQPASQPGATASGGSNGAASTDRRGLTGSARLLQDITQLDQYAFLTGARKLQLTKTISLTQLAPLEFQQFRTTGVLPFSTSTALFDKDFPGHYVRLIKRVRVSVVALVPPNQGIKASLATTGISRTVIGGDVFQTVTIQRSPELVALTSPMNATGLFELDAQPELLLPFEGTGVDTSWELRLPKAANLFDYTSIADVLLTMDYTALDSPDYRQQVIKSLDRNVSLDRAFSFRQDLPDLWYTLNNPDQSTPPFNVLFSTKQADFPPNIDRLQIQNVLLYFVRDDHQAFEISNASLTVTTQDLPRKTVGGTASSNDGTISIRRGNASSWVPMVDRSPIGDWTLTLQDTPDTSAGPGTRTLFQSGAIQDILFVISYRGKTPAWLS
jgi:hypothetical protein